MSMICQLRFKVILPPRRQRCLLRGLRLLCLNARPPFLSKANNVLNAFYRPISPRFLRGTRIIFISDTSYLLIDVKATR